jgi:predicted naringenin-chalcone synthase
MLPQPSFRTGLGDETAVPLSIKYAREAECNITGSRQEFADTCFSTIEALLAKTGVAPRDISFVVTNSSLFNPTPSLSAMIMNQFKMGKRTRGYSLGGMGCRCVCVWALCGCVRPAAVKALPCHCVRACSCHSTHTVTHTPTDCVFSAPVMFSVALCSAGVIAIDLAVDLLQVHPNCLVLVVSHENISNAYYTGKV